jgi:hypothetical protein
MPVYVTCRDITGHTREELTSLCNRVRARATATTSEDQREASRLLLEAFAAFVAEKLPVPRDIRTAVADMVARGVDPQGRMAA